MDVSIMIVAWNVRQLLEECLESVFEQTSGIDFEVIYVDNASEDGSIEMAREKFPEVKIIENKENMGFIKANNQAIKVANGRYVMLLNSDTIVLDNAIAKMVKFADSSPEAAVIGCRVLNRERELRRNCFMCPSILNLFLSATYLYRIFPRSRFFGRERMTWWDFDQSREVETVSGSCSFVRKQAIDEVGMMDERYFVYGDDPDWCFRFREKGWKILFTPDPNIIHYGGQNTKQMARTFRWQLTGSGLIFMKLHRSKALFPIACFLCGLFFFIRVPYWLISAARNKDDRSKSLETAATYLIGSYYCLTNWRKLLINREVLEGEL